ncbi:MAG: 1-acylglycerol-3-phosphate O-acyltransferase [Steroidobacteraceae bacterium]
MTRCSRTASAAIASRSSPRRRATRSSRSLQNSASRTSVSTELEVADGRFTGALQGRPCWGAQKLEAARRYLEQHKLAPRSAWFYTDAHEDLPLLEQVGHPVALNPDAKLTAVARRRGWPSARFTSRTRPGAEDLARTVLAFGSFLPALGLGALSWLRNRSMRKAASRTFQTWAELALVMSGIEMNVTGRQYLWMHRPAIFVFNHQSLLDGFILPALIQGQFTVMGKKEAGDVPLIGQTVQAAGFILFDRDDPQKAREAANRAAEMVRDGSSLLISPEGTRSHGNKLQRFKKGAFHIALQTRVPIVPVVIRNATELWPRGSNFLRPGTVDIEVLPPISTTDWKLETLQQHVDAVRALFLERLGQED